MKDSDKAKIIIDVLRRFVNDSVNTYINSKAELEREKVGHKE